MILPSHSHVQCILNGTRISQWADTDPPYEIETEDDVQVETSHDGTHFPMSNSNLGGNIKLHLIPHSKDVEWFLQRESKRQSDIINRLPTEQFNGTLQDIVTGISVSLDYGYIIKIPRFPVAGQAFEVMMGFARIDIKHQSSAWSNFGVYPNSSVNDRAPGFRGTND